MVWRESTERAVGREDSQAWGGAKLQRFLSCCGFKCRIWLLGLQMGCYGLDNLCVHPFDGLLSMLTMTEM